MRDKEALKAVFLNYAERYDTKNVMIFHKIEHTFRVAELSERYADALGMGSEDAVWAWFFGLLHDIGRFEQVRRFGTFDVRASDINEEMKMAAAMALANLISDEELNADYIIPKAFDPRVGPAVAKAVAEAAIRSGVARI